jgi:ABC-type transport system involved in multi-copper enzyme maturation permease subunit
MMKLTAIAYNTFKEAVRDKILYNLLMFALLMIGGSILLATLTVGEQSKIIMDFGLASIDLFGVLIAIFLGIGLVSKEIEKRTVYTVLSKPIGRPQFLLGKYAGLLLTLLVNSVIMTAGLYLVLMLNQARWGHSIWSVEPRLIEAVYLIYLELMILTAVALMFSTFTTSTLAAIFSLSVYVIGHVSGDLMAMSEKFSGDALGYLLKGLYYTLPNLGQFDIKGQIVHGIPVTPAYFFLTSCYALVYIIFLFVVATMIFQRRDFK